MKSALLLPLLLLAFAPLPVHAIEAGDPNGTPADTPNILYNPLTQTGRLDKGGDLSPFSGVGSLDGGTGTLLDSTHVLTAAHLFGGSTDPSGISFNLNGASFVVSNISLCPGGIGGDFSNDLAIVTLRDAVPSTYKTYSLYTGTLADSPTLTLVGYGATGDGVNGYGGGDFGRRVGKNNADGFLLPNGDVSDTYTAGAASYVYDFDGPDASTNVLGGTTLGNDVETNIGTGDSGGPAFIVVNGQYEIAALNNFKARFGPDNQHLGPDYGYFGSGGGGPIVSNYTAPGGFLSPYAAPEPSVWVVFALGGAGLFAVKRRRQPVDC